MFDILGIDWGHRRFGLAFADSTSQLILAADYPCDTDRLWEILEAEVHRRQPRTIVVGQPTNFAGQNTAVTDQVTHFVSQLQCRFPNIQVVTVNERHSTQEASLGHSLKLDKQQLNHLSAVRILEFYFGIEKS